MQKNAYYETQIQDLTIEGSGVCRIEGMTVFVPGTAIGDQIRVKIVKVLKHYAYGIVESILTPSPHRVEPACSLTPCGGCMFQHIHYAAQLQVKARAVESAFTRIGKLAPQFLPILGAPATQRYRNKAQYPFALDKGGNPVLGFFARRSHRVIPVADCLLQPVVFSQICGAVLEEVRQRKIHVYDEIGHTGLLRHLYLRQGAHTGEIMVCFVVRKDAREALSPLVSRLIAQFPEIRSICQNINPHKTNVILGDQTQTLWGKGTIQDTMCGVTVDLSPESFYQVNTPAAEQLYGVAKTFAALDGTGRLLDLYCGAGTIGLSMADQVEELIGVEIVPEAVENAKKNAARAGVQNARFYCGDAGTIAQKLAAAGKRPDVIVVDPPRKGCDQAAIQAIVQMAPQRIVMISCNPATAARDCKALGELGYAAQKVQAVDLFPGTGHVECVVLLSRNED